MEGKYTKIGTILGAVALLITIIQWVAPEKKTLLKGEWKMTSTVQEAKLSTYVGMEIGWQLLLIQDGKTVSGTGEKIRVNKNELDFKDRTRIELEGIIEDDAFTLQFIEKGKLRETVGVFTGTVKDDTFEGVFSQTASDSKGIISGKKR